jgi:hypothetical protein
MKELVLKFTDPAYTIRVTKSEIAGLTHVIFTPKIDSTSGKPTPQNKFEMFLDQENVDLLMSFLGEQE